MSDPSVRNSAVIEFMKTRRSVPAKTMGGPGPNVDEIAEMAEIAMRVPDHGKIAPWRFVEYSSAAKERLDRLILARALEKQPDLEGEMKSVETGRMARSPTVINWSRPSSAACSPTSR